MGLAAIVVVVVVDGQKLQVSGHSFTHLHLLLLRHFSLVLHLDAQKFSLPIWSWHTSSSVVADNGDN